MERFMQKIPALCVGALAVSAAFAVLPAQAQTVAELVEQVKAMRQQLESQRARIDELERDVRSARRNEPLPAPAAAAAPAPALAGTAASAATQDELAATRGTGAADIGPLWAAPLAAPLAASPAAPASG